MTRSLFLGAIALLLAPALAPAADPFAETVEKANKKLVKLFGAGGFQRLNNYGTGIVISKDGHILTVASQLLDTSELVVHLYDGQRLRAQVLGDRAAARRRAGSRSRSRGRSSTSRPGWTSTTSTSTRR
jgi:S1-C subfamily serine protease